MRKYLFLLLIYACFCGLLSGQTDSEPEESRFGWGLLYGVNFNKFSETELRDCDDRIGVDLFGGAAFRYDLSDGVAIGTELIVDRVKASVKSYHPHAYAFQQLSTVETTRLKLPVCIELYGVGYVEDIRPSFGFGGYIAVPIKVKVKDEFDYESSNATHYSDITNDCPRFTPGIQVRAGVRYSHLFWQLRFNQDLTSFSHPNLDVGRMQYQSVEFVIGIIGLQSWFDGFSADKRF
jgi:hypothetical protein